MDGAAGVALAGAEQPDLIRMDLGLPVLNGWDVTRQLKADEVLCEIMGGVLHACLIYNLLPLNEKK